MDASCASRARHYLGRLAVVGAVALGAPVALAGVADAAPKGHWDRIAKCESGGRWNTATGNGYYGGLRPPESADRHVRGLALPESTCSRK